MKDQRLSVDTISTLPPVIIETILCLLPIQEAARTSILSREWRYKWTTIPKIEFNDETFQHKAFDKEHALILSKGIYDVTYDREHLTRRFSFFVAICQVLFEHQGPIHEFTLSMLADETYLEIDQVINHLSRKNTVKKFTLNLYHESTYRLPLCAFPLHHLTDLHLGSCYVYLQPSFSGFGSLTSLSLEYVTISGEMLLHLLSKCPLLTRLSLFSVEEYIDESSITQLFECLPVIEHLAIWGCAITFVDLSCFVPKEHPTLLVHLKYFSIDEMLYHTAFPLPLLAFMMRSSPNLEKLMLHMNQEEELVYQEEQVVADNAVKLENDAGQKQKKSRASRKRSFVWDHYDSFVNKKGEHKSSCKYCPKEYFSDTKVHGTSTLRGHLRHCENFPGNKSTGQTSLTIQAGEGDDDRRMIGWKFDQQSIRKALSYMIVVDELPFKFVEGKGFKHFLNVCQPAFRVISRITMARDCYQLYLEEKKKVSALLKGNVGRICLTTDTWTSVQRINYMSLTAHFIDNDWKIKKKVLNFCPISSHRGVDIGKAVEMCLIKWGIESNVFTITVDNATANDVAVTYLKSKFANWDKCVLEAKWLHVRCIAHIMNLIVQDGLSHIGSSVDCVRAAVKYIRQSPQRLRKFKEYAEIEKCPSTKALILDVPTRWNSTYLMLETAQNYERAFARYDSEDRHFREDLEKTGVPAFSDWANVKRLAKFLQHFYDLTLKVSGTRYVTSNTFLDDITSIDSVLKSCLSGARDPGLVDMAKLMKSKYDKYFGNIDKCNRLTLVASMLDPTRKKEYMEVLLVDVYGELKGATMSTVIEDFLYEIFEDYVRIHTPPDSPSNSKQSDSSASFDIRSTPTVMEPSIMLKQKVRMEMKRRKTQSGLRDSKSELDRYLKEDTEDESERFDVLNWWKVNSPRFPVLSLVARDVLAIPISTVASESVFSTSGRVLDAFRSSLTPAIVECLICTQDWLRSTSMPDVAENWEELIQVEEELLQV